MFVCSFISSVLGMLRGRRSSEGAFPTEIIIVEDQDDHEKSGLVANQAPSPEYEQAAIEKV